MERCLSWKRSHVPGRRPDRLLSRLRRLGVWDLRGGAGTLTLGVLFLALGGLLTCYLVNLQRFLGYDEGEGE